MSMVDLSDVVSHVLILISEGRIAAAKTLFKATGLCAVFCSVGAVHAAEYGQVLSSTPVLGQVPVAQQQCRDEQQVVQKRPSGNGAVVGGLIGGALGNVLGRGAGQAASTGVGIVAGAILGDRVEAANTPPTEVTVRNCAVVTAYENRVVAYDVVYEYNGGRYSTRMGQDPGPRIELAVSVTPVGPQMSQAVPPPADAVAPPQPAAVTVYAQPPVIYMPAPGYGYYGYGEPHVQWAPRLFIGGGYVYRGYGHHGYWR